VIATGASGGLGSFAVALLADRGFKVAAATGRSAEADYLKRLGAAEIVERAELSTPPRLLGKERWAGAVDAVGGLVLANVITMTATGGAIAACGNAGGMELNTSVAPFILRGVSLLGIDSVRAAKAARDEAWQRLARDLDRNKLATMTTTIAFDSIPAAARDIVDGKVRGRLVVEIG
jgi:acrylyl-CoA reductase (NADPH)